MESLLESDMLAAVVDKGKDEEERQQAATVTSRFWIGLGATWNAKSNKRHGAFRPHLDFTPTDTLD